MPCVHGSSGTFCRNSEAKGVDGQMLGFPIITEPLDPASEIDYARNTYDECVAQIIKDCDSAYKYLPIAHRDFLVPDAG